MALPITPVGGLPRIDLPGPAGGARGAGSFDKILSDSIAHVEGMRAEAGAAVGRLLAGEGEDLHTAALQAQQAELGFELFLQVRNKVVQAYQEVMRMQM